MELLLEHFRAYRTYAMGDTPDPPPGAAFEAAVASAHGDAGREESKALAFVADVMRGARADAGQAAREAARRFNQLAAPVAAKAVEDTAFYRYGRILSRNDVGFSPARFAMTATEFHAAAGERGRDFPHSLLTTATHDDKRGEDVRARLAALSELPAQWEDTVREWFTLNAQHRTAAVATGDEYQLYQTLVGAWPFTLAADDREAIAAFTERILGWREKSLREAKLVTSWTAPNETVEAAHAAFVRDILDPSHGFGRRLAAFVDWLAPAAVLNSLVACVLRYTLPGVPDLYQGAELWDLSLVDPDNRRSVDFHLRQTLLENAHDPIEHMRDWRSGRVKLALIARLLSLRAENPELFQGGDYTPLDTGDNHVVAFLRAAGESRLLVAVPRLSALAAIARAQPLPDGGIGEDVFARMAPDLARRTWHNGLLPDMPPVQPERTGALFAHFPAAIFRSPR